MKPLPAILLTVLIVAVGIAAYDRLRCDAPAEVAGEGADDGDVVPGPRLGRTQAERLAARLASAEERLDALGRELEALGARTEAAGGPSGSHASIAEAAEEPPMDYDPEVLAALKVHLVELRRREQEKAERARLERVLANLPFAFDEAQRRQLVEAAVAFRVDARDRATALQDGGVTDPAVLGAEYAKLHAAFVERIRPLVSPSELERVVGALVGTPGQVR